jgi:hypothetical protein
MDMDMDMDMDMVDITKSKALKRVSTFFYVYLLYLVEKNKFNHFTLSKSCRFIQPLVVLPPYLKFV